MTCSNNRTCPSEQSISISLSNVKRGVEKCTHRVPLRYNRNHEDKITPVILVTKIAPISNHNFVVDPNSSTEINQTLSIWKDCADQYRCRSQLLNSFGELNCTSVDFVTRGMRETGKKPIKLKVLFTVSGDPSFNTKMFITHPEGARFSKIYRIGSGELQIPYHCEQTADLLLTCLLGNPLAKGKVVNFLILILQTH